MMSKTERILVESAALAEAMNLSLEGTDPVVILIAARLFEATITSAARELDPVSLAIAESIWESCQGRLQEATANAGCHGAS